MRQLTNVATFEDEITLKKELDYELDVLFAAMQKGDEEQKAKSKQRLSEIHAILGLGVLS